MSSKEKKVRVRFAPSPTGALHIGGLRTALYNYLFARKHQGIFVVRVEDTDRERSLPEAEAYIEDSLAWCGLAYDEGPDAGGPFGPYRQSERTELYHRYVDQLIKAGHAYYAFDTREELDQMRHKLATEDNPSPRYDASTRHKMNNAFTLTEHDVFDRIDRGDEYVVRLKVPDDKRVQFDDLVRGPVSFASEEIDDQILLKSDGMPTYHLANVVDDHLMEITHVIRGEEWLPSTPKHILLYQYFGWDPPELAHLPLILSPTGGKLSKRKADKMGIPINVLEYRDAGYEPEPLINFLALLGWNPGTDREIFTLDDLVETFTLERIGVSGVQFDIQKLNWFNQQFIKSLPLDELVSRIEPTLGEAVDSSDPRLPAALELMQERLTLSKDFIEESRFLFFAPDTFDEKGVKKRWKADSGSILSSFSATLGVLDPFEADALERALKQFVENHEIGMGKIMAPLRLALSGDTHGPDLYRTMEILGKKDTLDRIKRAVDRLGG